MGRALRCIAGATLAMTLNSAAIAAPAWRVVDRLFFPRPIASDARGQGMTSDGVHWIFSGTRSLEITDARFHTLKRRRHAIPSVLWHPFSLSPIGLNHIGDIDHADGRLYVPVDSNHVDPASGKAYTHPVVAIYDARTLRFTGRAFPLRPPHGTDDIASWIAVDAAKGVAYGIAYRNARELAVYDLIDFTFRRYIPLSRPVDQAQSGKVRDGWIYFATDGDAKAIMRADLSTGDVETIASLARPGSREIEGLSVEPNRTGALVHVLSREDDSPKRGSGGIALYRLEGR